MGTVDNLSSHFLVTLSTIASDLSRVMTSIFLFFQVYASIKGKVHQTNVLFGFLYTKQLTG